MPTSPETTGGRSRAREFALSVLFASEYGGASETERIYEDLESVPDVGGGVDPYARRLVEKVGENRSVLDETIRVRLQNWSLDRLGTIDRLVLRIGACELLYYPDVPAEVVIDEAVELAKRFGGENSGRFVNGILDTLRKDLLDGRVST